MMKKLIKNLFQYLGYDLVRKQKNDYTWLKEMGINTVFDIGANIGQYASEIREVFPSAQIYSFEPVATCHEQLIENMKEDKFFKAFNLALGGTNGDMTINKNEHTPASSMLEVGDLHKKHFNYAVNVNTEVITMNKLDTIVKELTITHPFMIKIDVQGYEMNVLSGALQTIKKAKLIIIETTFDPLYKEQPLFDDIYKKLTQNGFYYHGSEHQVRSSIDRRVMQENSVFISR